MNVPTNKYSFDSWIFNFEPHKSSPRFNWNQYLLMTILVQWKVEIVKAYYNSFQSKKIGKEMLDLLDERIFVMKATKAMCVWEKINSLHFFKKWNEKLWRNAHWIWFFGRGDWDSCSVEFVVKWYFYKKEKKVFWSTMDKLTLYLLGLLK